MKKDLELLNQVREILEPTLKELDFRLIGKHNKSYMKKYAEDPFHYFVELEWPYYSKVIGWYIKNVPKTAKVLEIGMFIPTVPLALSILGYKVTTIERFNLYGNALDGIVKLASSKGISIIDSDIVENEIQNGPYDVINLLAVVEHLLGSPKLLLQKIHKSLHEDGRLVFVVPNQARLQCRLGLMFLGLSVQPCYEDYFQSCYPFEGHNREYVKSEVLYALQHSGFKTEEISAIRYPMRGSALRRMVGCLQMILPMTFQQAFFAIGKPIGC